MPDITLTPIPYGGGTLAMTTVNSHICHLYGNRFFALFAQTTPNYLIAATIDANDVHAATPTLSVVKQRVLGTTALTRTRLWKLNSATVLALVNTDLKVFTVQPDGDVVQQPAQLLGFHTTTLWGTESLTALGIGNMLYGKTVADNTVFFVQRSSTTGAIALNKVVFDPVGGTLTKTVITTLQASTTATHLWRFFINAIPGTNNFLVYALGGNTTTALSTIPNYYIVDNIGNVMQAVTAGIPSTIKALTPLEQYRVIGIKDANTYVSYADTGWTVADTTFAAAATASTITVATEALDSQHFITLSTTSGLEPCVGTYSFRVSRYLDPDFGQTSAATNAGNGLSYANANVYFDQQVLYVLDSTYETLAIFSRPTATSFAVRILYQPNF